MANCRRSQESTLVAQMRHQEQQRQRRGSTRTSSVRRDKDEDLSLFQEMRKLRDPATHILHLEPEGGEDSTSVWTSLLVSLKEKKKKKKKKNTGGRKGLTYFSLLLCFLFSWVAAATNLGALLLSDPVAVAPIQRKAVQPAAAADLLNCDAEGKNDYDWYVCLFP